MFDYQRVTGNRKHQPAEAKSPGKQKHQAGKRKHKPKKKGKTPYPYGSHFFP